MFLVGTSICVWHYLLPLLIEIGLTDLTKYGDDQSRSTFFLAALIRQYILYFSRAVLNRLNKFENPQMIASAKTERSGGTVE